MFENIDKCGLGDFGYRIFLDRYAMKDLSGNVKEGQIVLAKVKGQKEIGIVEMLTGDGKAAVRIGDQPADLFHIEQLDVPIELSPRDMRDRLATAVTNYELSIYPYADNTYADFMWLLEDWKFVPGGRILAGMGSDTDRTFYNCFVIPNPEDSKVGIFHTANVMAQIMSRGGGVGINISSLRPRYARTYKTDGRSSGAVSWGELYSFVTGLIEIGGSRRGAILLMLNDWHPDIEEFITVKQNMSRILNANISIGVSDKFMEAVRNDEDWNLIFPDTSHPDYDRDWDGDITKWIETKGVNSVVVHKTVKAKELWEAIITSAWKCAEPGLWFADKTNGMSNSWYYAPLICCNPCVTGDSLVALANGEGNVSIKQLAEDGIDVPVYCYSKDKGIVISMGRNPRKTGENVKVWKVVLDDGTSLKATANHKFMLRNGNYVELKDLKTGDSLMPFRKRLDKKGYVRVNDNIGGEQFEHKKILEYALGKELQYPEEVTHHKNGIKVDNRPENLEVVSASEHNSAHMKGDNNPMRFWWNSATKEEKQRYHDTMSKATSGKLNGNYGNKNPNGWKTRFRNGVIRQAKWLLEKYGEPITGELWDAEYENYVTSTCDKSASHWNVVMKLFSDEAAIRKACLEYNHKVVSIEFAGEEDVYNITVDKYHNLAYVTYENEEYEQGPISNYDTGIVTKNCGEESLTAWSVCLLGSVNLASDEFYGTIQGQIIVNWKSLKKVVKLAVRFLDDTIGMTPHFMDEINEQQHKERRIGLGTMGLADMLLKLGYKYGSKESLEFVDDLFNKIAIYAYEASIDLAKERGAFPEYDEKFLSSGYMKTMKIANPEVWAAVKKHGIRNVTLLTQAPTGTTGTMVGVSTGIEPYFAWKYTRNSRLGSYTEYARGFLDYCKEKSIEPSDEALAAFIKVEPAAVTAQDLTPEEHIKMQATIQKWIDSSISKTCNVPNHYTVEQVGELYQLMYDLGCKGGTIYRDGSRDKQVLELKSSTPSDTPGGPQRTLLWRTRPTTLNGETHRLETPVGATYLTLNSDDNGLFEVFVSAGKVGSAVTADAEGFGRLISLILRMPDGLAVEERIKAIVKQLGNIGSDRSFGFGPNRVSSLPDAIAKVLSEEYQLKEAELPALPESITGDLCPGCGQATLIRIEGCRKCYSCGHAEC